MLQTKKTDGENSSVVIVSHVMDDMLGWLKRLDVTCRKL